MIDKDMCPFSSSSSFFKMKTYVSFPYHVAIQWQTPRMSHESAENMGRKGVPGLGPWCRLLGSHSENRFLDQPPSLSIATEAHFRCAAFKQRGKWSLLSLGPVEKMAKGTSYPNRCSWDAGGDILFSQCPCGKCFRRSLPKGSLIAYFFLGNQSIPATAKTMVNFHVNF